MKHVDLLTDGACSGNPGPGGWGAVLRYGEVEKELSGGEAETTNNRMELKAAMSALNLSSATDLERLERRLRSFSQRLEDVEEQIDDLSRELGALRRKNAKPARKKTETNPQP